MAGIRITWARKWPPIFDKHPIPWNIDYHPLEAVCSIRDARGRQVLWSHMSRTQAIIVYLYQFVVPPFYPTAHDDPAHDFRGIPTVLIEHQLPWRIEIMTDKQMYPHGVKSHMDLLRMLDANDRTIGWCNSGTHYVHVFRGILDLSVMAHDILQRQERGLRGSV